MKTKSNISRRRFLAEGIGAGILGVGGAVVLDHLRRTKPRAEVFIGRATSYGSDLTGLIGDGLGALGVGAGEIRGKRILLKPNFVETVRGARHICTQPEVLFAAVEAFARLGAAKVIVGEGSGHCRDTARVLGEADVVDGLIEYKTPFVDLNEDDLLVRPNAGRHNGLDTLTLPATLEQVDWIVSMPKLKTHHWAGVTLSMKNLFGVMPGIVYGWPKNVFHWAGIESSILDIHATVKPHFAIIDGIVGMEGDGPIMGTAKPAGVIVMGRRLPAVDATAARIMGIDPLRIRYLRTALHRLEAARPEQIDQRGEPIAAVRTDFQLLDSIPAHQGIRLPKS